MKNKANQKKKAVRVSVKKAPKKDKKVSDIIEKNYINDKKDKKSKVTIKFKGRLSESGIHQLYTNFHNKIHKGSPKTRLNANEFYKLIQSGDKIELEGAKGKLKIRIK